VGTLEDLIDLDLLASTGFVAARFLGVTDFFIAGFFIG
jgi:hypothetical protein